MTEVRTTKSPLPVKLRPGLHPGCLGTPESYLAPDPDGIVRMRSDRPATYMVVECPACEGTFAWLHAGE